ncbi:MAG TPA: hypothetical protein VGN22_07075 [Pseudonocardia sp.]
MSEPQFCDQCGSPADEGEHPRCAARRELEPPRFCPDCARRMVVQVTPTSWTARCSRHGERRSADQRRDTDHLHV